MDFALKLEQQLQFLYKHGVTFHCGVSNAKIHSEVRDAYTRQATRRTRYIAAAVSFTAKAVIVLAAWRTRVIFAARGFIFTSAFTLAMRVNVTPCHRSDSLHIFVSVNAEQVTSAGGQSSGW